MAVYIAENDFAWKLYIVMEDIARLIFKTLVPGEKHSTRTNKRFYIDINIVWEVRQNLFCDTRLTSNPSEITI
jgi:hypothetical protein